MAFADPQGLTVNAVDFVLNRTQAASGNLPSIFQTADPGYKLLVQHTYGKRVRRVARVDHVKIDPDPLQPETNVPYTMSCYLVVDVPPFGFTVADQKLITLGLTNWLTVSSAANVSKLLGGET